MAVPLSWFRKRRPRLVAAASGNTHRRLPGSHRHPRHTPTPRTYIAILDDEKTPPIPYPYGPSPALADALGSSHARGRLRTERGRILRAARGRGERLGAMDIQPVSAVCRQHLRRDHLRADRGRQATAAPTHHLPRHPRRGARQPDRVLNSFLIILTLKQSQNYA